MGSAVKFRNASIKRQAGELARLKIIQGPDYGSVYVISGPRATVGRGEDSDVMISDLKASRLHAEFSLSAAGWSVRDMGSANGILFNGAPSRSATLKTGDVITLGETTLEFITSSEAATMFLVAPARTPASVQADQAALAAQKEKIKSLGLFGGVFGKQKSKPSSTGGARNNRTLLLIVAALGVFMFTQFSEEEHSKPKTLQKPGDLSRDLAAYLPKSAPGPAGKTADMFFRSGFREYREKNYIRARTNFETVLQIVPGHREAKIYLENCNKEIEEEVKFHLEYGKKSLDAGKLKDARGHFEAVLRLLYRETSSPDFIEAKEQLDKVQRSVAGESS